MKNVRPIMVILGVISVVELIMTKDMVGSFWLWILYGLYRFFSDDGGTHITIG